MIGKRISPLFSSTSPINVAFGLGPDKVFAKVSAGVAIGAGLSCTSTVFAALI